MTESSSGSNVTSSAKTFEPSVIPPSTVRGLFTVRADCINGQATFPRRLWVPPSNGIKCMRKRLFQLAGPALALALAATPNLLQSETVSHLEMAARMNVAENLCDIHFNSGVNPSGVVHHTMMAAAELNISLAEAARLADARHAEIVSYLNQTSQLDEFCQNARNGQL